MSQTFDLVVIGAGPGGYTAAISAARHGMKTAIVESRQAGGTCLNRGCIPTKTLLYAGNLFYEMNHSEKIGIIAGQLRYDIQAMYRRKNEVVSGLREGIETLLRANGVERFHGTATVASAKQVRVNTGEERLSLETEKVLIATGSVPARPSIEGIDLPGVITSNELLEEYPVDYKSLMIIGGGVIGVEFASVFSALGCQVTIIEALDRILPTMDREISQNLSMILKKRGVAIHTGCCVEQIAGSEGELLCRFSGSKGSQEIRAQGVLVSTGRKACTEGLFDAGLQIRQERGIVVDERFETSSPGIYAVGDVVAGSTQLAHAAAAQARNAVAAMAGEQPPADASIVPGCVFTSPEIASVGITADQAREKGIAVKTGKYSMAGNGKTIIEQQERSFVKLVFDAESEVLLGAQLMCARASDLVSELSSAVVNGLTMHQLAAVIRPHPTFTEAVTEAVEDAMGRAIHSMPKKR